MKFILTITIMLMTLTGCSSVSSSVSDSSENKGESAQLQNQAQHDHTVDESTKKDYSNFETVKEEALNDAEFVDSLTEEELEFAKKIRPLHFDLKTMILRMTGTGVLFLSGGTDEESLVKVREEADEKITFIESELNKLDAPQSMEHIHSAYLESVQTYEESIPYFEQYFETEDKKFLDEFLNRSNQANAGIKSVLFEMWTDELNAN
ncbi:hypothetical protein J7I93_04455 [Bacillus sp. ISL-47]|uniref:hypothetical protein n=1 Tax=Bacillus sp. ISL-47 TaxID=2819130 RepID=UPI001BE6C7DF|nr:hypothetical protein [Bacillus sp. ISL-47]MBT2687430.1 hypothetical protein [Bacillus sp. ISL-47]MBT2707108.1 hypothetical protein [Pseudomonas sp. ISL-84]